ncbi:MAG: Spy/CpxP family protein refolding chaperone [Bryobacteraceae bacterium]
MHLNVNSKLAAILLAAMLVPALAFSQTPAPEPPEGQGPGGAPTVITARAFEDPDMEMGPGMDMDMGPGMDMQMGPGMGMGMGHVRGMAIRMEGENDMGLGRAIHDPKLREQLGITPEQVTKIQQEMLSFQKAEIMARADVEVKRLDLHSLLEAENPDPAAIEKSLRAANAAQFVLEKAQIDHQLATRALLTPEQRQKLQKMREEAPRHFAGPGGPGGIMHPGENVFFYRRDGGGVTHPGGNEFFLRRDAGGIVHPGGDVMYMRTPRVEKRVIVRSGEATAVPAPPPPPEPKQ